MGCHEVTLGFTTQPEVFANPTGPATYQDLALAKVKPKSILIQ
jgi:hypothetical protein